LFTIFINPVITNIWEKLQEIINTFGMTNLNKCYQNYKYLSHEEDEEGEILPMQENNITLRCKDNTIPYNK
jgi:hypothetical protein